MPASNRLLTEPLQLSCDPASLLLTTASSTTRRSELSRGSQISRKYKYFALFSRKNFSELSSNDIVPVHWPSTMIADCGRRVAHVSASSAFGNFHRVGAPSLRDFRKGGEDTVKDSHYESCNSLKTDMGVAHSVIALMILAHESFAGSAAPTARAS